MTTSYGDGISALRSSEPGSQRSHQSGAMTTPNHRETSTLHPLSHVPFRRDPRFIGRHTQFSEIYNKLRTAVAIVGPEGIGKSHLAIESVYRVREKTPGLRILWIQASDVVHFEQSIRKIAQKLKALKYHNARVDSFQTVRAWLQDKRNGPMLVVLDNVNDADSFVCRASADVARPNVFCIPTCDHVRTLIISRNRTVAERLVGQSSIVDVPPLDKQDAIALLTRELGQIEKTHEMDVLATALECIPLAIMQAAAFLRPFTHEDRVCDYLQDLNRRYKEGEGIYNGHLRNPIVLTWQISFEHLRNWEQQAGDLLILMCFCHGLLIPRCLVDESTQDPATCRSSTENIDTLLRHSLIGLSDDASMIEINGLIKVATIQWVRAYELRDLYDEHAKRFIKRLDRILTQNDPNVWQLYEMLFPHACSALNLMLQSRQEVSRWARIFTMSARYASEGGSTLLWRQALRLGEQCYEASKRALGEQAIDSLMLTDVLASYYDWLGDSKKAVELQAPCWEAMTKPSAQHHPDKIIAAADIRAWYYHRLGESKEALELQRRCWNLCKQQYGEMHENTILSMSTLAMYHHNVGNSETARKLEDWCLVVSQRQHERGSQKLASMSNLAEYHHCLGDSVKAKDIAEECWQARIAQLGEDHRNTLISMSNLAAYYNSLGCIEKAVEIEDKCLDLRTIALGMGHPHTLKSLNNLAEYFYRLGKTKSARDAEEVCLNARKRRLGEMHRDTLISMCNLAKYYDGLGLSRSAFELEQQCWYARKDQLGERHRETLISMGNLAGYLHRLGQTKEAIEVEARCYNLRATTLGETHPDTLVSTKNLQGYHSYLRCSMVSEETKI